MIHSTSESPPYRTQFSDGVHQGVADTTADKGGGGSGFRPHDLLEASLATCVNITVRMYADSRAIPLRAVTTRVSMDYSRPEEVVFRYEVDFDGDLTAEQKGKLHEAAKACAIRRILLRKIRFESEGDASRPATA